MLYKDTTCKDMPYKGMICKDLCYDILEDKLIYIKKYMNQLT